MSATGTANGQVKDAEIAAEQERVNVAYVRLEEMREDAQRMLAEGFRQAQAGTKSSLVDRDAMVYQASLRAEALNVADDGLVFGRLDLTAHAPLYIGRIGVRTKEHDSLVVDWRAPAAEAFYRATPEDAHEVIRRRVLHSRGHRVIDIEDDLLQPELADGLTVVGDGAFLASLARTREGSMRDIVSTIQREQDLVIRAPADGTVIVRGGPGTGKTAVALHRVAYLLFRHRRRFGGRGVLIVGPNQRFTAYIERVLPSLGEGSAVLRSLGDLVPGAVATRHDSPELTRIKGSGSMVRLLRRAVTDHPPGAPELLTVVHAGVVVKLDRPRLDKIRNQIHQRSQGTINTARRKAADALLDALWNRFLEIGGLVDAPGIKRHEFVANARDQFGGFLGDWWPTRTPTQVLRSLGDVERLKRAAGRDLKPDQIGRLAASFAVEDTWSYQDVALLDEIDALLGKPPRPTRQVREDDPYVIDGVNIITGEEVADWEPEMRELSMSIDRYDRARRVNDEAEEANDFGHVVVNEAQDLSPMQWRMLGRRGRQATWTVVEDPAQSSWEDLEASRQAMANALGTAATRRNARPQHSFELTTNYRNTVEIAAVATRVLAHAVPDARPARAVRTSGHDATVLLVPASSPGGPVGGAGTTEPAQFEPAQFDPGLFDLAEAVQPELALPETSGSGQPGIVQPGAGRSRSARRRRRARGGTAAAPEPNGQAAVHQTSSFVPLPGKDRETLLHSARDAVVDLLGQVEGTIGVILPLGWPQDEWDVPDRVQLLDVLEAKGLEFDAAVIVAPEEIAAQSPMGLRTLYVAVSRATQRLTVLTTSPRWEAVLTGTSTTL